MWRGGGRLNEFLFVPNSLSVHLDNPPVRESVVLHQEGGLLGQLLLGVDVVGHVAELLLHHPHRFEVGGVIECIALEQQQLDEVSGDVPAGDIQSLGEMRQSEALVDRTDVSDAVTRVNNNSYQYQYFVINIDLNQSVVR